MKILHIIILILKGMLFWCIILFIVMIINAIDTIIVYIGHGLEITLLLLLVLFLSLKFFFSKKERYLISGMCLIELVYRTLSEYIIKVSRVKRIKKLRKGVRTEKKEEKKTEKDNQKQEKS